MARVAVLGAGRMGAAMAARLADRGHIVVLWNRTRARADAVAEKEPRVAVEDRPEDAVRGCEVVLSILTDGAATCAVLLDPAVVEALDPGCVVVDHATSGPEAARAVADELGQRGLAFLDAPVSGSIPAVQAGTLLVMASGPKEAVDRATPVLHALARNVIRVGDAGAGQVMKLAVNLVLHDLNAAMAEALQLAEAADIAREDAYTVFEESVVGAPYVQYKRAAFLEENAPVAMSLALVEKDLGLVLGQARAAGRAAPVTQAALGAVHAAVEAGLGAHDMADLSRHIVAAPAVEPPEGTSGHDGVNRL